MISQEIQAKYVDQNTKNWKGPPKSSKNEIFIFGLCSTSDDWPSDPSIKHWQIMQKKTKKTPWVMENKMFIFELCSTSDCWPSNLSEKHWQIMQKKTKKQKKDPLSHQKIKCSFFIYVQKLLMIGQVIWAKNIDWNAKCSTSDDWLRDPSKKNE